jgi:hypothetical protein
MASRPQSAATFSVESGFMSEGIKRPAKYLYFSGNLFDTRGIISNERVFYFA